MVYAVPRSAGTQDMGSNGARFGRWYGHDRPLGWEDVEAHEANAGRDGDDRQNDDQ